MNFVVRGEMLHRTAAATADALLQSNILVVSSSIQHTLIAGMDADKGVYLLDSMSFPDVTLRVYRRGG